MNDNYGWPMAGAAPMAPMAPPVPMAPMAPMTPMPMPPMMGNMPILLPGMQEQAMPMMPQPQSEMAPKPKNTPMMQPLPFGGYRANGGPVQPGRAYVVGERGPELMVPQVPGTVLPNSAAASSPMNRPYAELAGGTGSLANRGTLDVGRWANDPGRMNDMAMRRLRSQGDIVGAARLANSNAWLEARMGGPAMRAPMPPMMLPPAPNVNRSGAPTQKPTWGTTETPNFPPDIVIRSAPVPSAGGAPEMPAPSAPEMPAPAAPEPPLSFEQAFNQSPLAGAGPAPMGQPLPPMQVPAGTLSRMPGLNQGAFKGAYQEAPPLMSTVPIPGTDQVQPLVMGQPKGAPVSRAQPPKPAAWEAPKMYDETIPEVRDANGNVTQPARTRQFYYVPDPQTGKPRKEYALDANGDGVPDNAAGQQPGWMGWLQSQK